MPPERRIATLVAFARVFEAVAQDDAVDLLQSIDHEMLGSRGTNRSAGAAAHHPRLGCGGYPTPGLKSRSGWVIGSNGTENRAG